MEVEKIAHDFRVDQQCRFEYLGVGLGKYQQFMFEFGEQLVVRPRSGHGMTNLPLDVYCLGKRAQVEADDRAFEPDLRCGDNLDGCSRVAGRDQYFGQGGHRFLNANGEGGRFLRAGRG